MKPEPAGTWTLALIQLRRRRVAWAACRATAFLFVLATVTPLLASDQPLLWGSPTGWSSPWLRALYDHNQYRIGVDFLFNTLLLPGLPAAAVAWATVRAGWVRGRVAALAWGVVWLVSFAGVQLVNPAQAEVNWTAEQATIEKAGGHVTVIYPPLPTTYHCDNLKHKLESASAAHPLGTDTEGCDTLTRLLYGTRISLTIGVFAVVLYCTLGCILGALAGFYGGRVDLVISTLIEVVMCVPQLLLVLAAAAVLRDRSVFTIMGLIAAVSWTGPARLVRAEFLKLRELDFVTAARAVGYPTRTIIFSEILPNALGPLLVSATFGVAGAILVESTMAFLGLGDPAAPSWGKMLNAGRNADEWALILAPGLAIFITVSLLNLVGEGVRDALDPKLRG